MSHVQLLLFYQTHGRFVLFGSLIFKLTMNTRAQKTGAAEVTLHSVYAMHHAQGTKLRFPGPCKKVCKLSNSGQHLIAVL